MNISLLYKNLYKNAHRIIPVIIFLFVIPKVSFAQFYNGHQMSFGKNRIQYHNEYWMYHRYEKFDSYFYADGKELSLRIAEIVGRKLPEVENYFGHGLQKRLIFLCYRNLSEFRESNVGYDTKDGDSNIGGVTTINRNKVFVYYEGEYKKLEKQVMAGITKVIINDMLYGGKYRQKLTNSTLINLPDWFISGLISYLSENWNFEIENKVKDLFESGKLKKINHLLGEEARIAGHSYWHFISETYGIDVIPNIIYMTRVNKNSESGFKYVIGIGSKELSKVWKDYYIQKFSQKPPNASLPEDDLLLLKAKKHTVFQQIKTDPKGKYIAYASNKQGRYKIWLYDKNKGKKKKIRAKGHHLEQITDYSYPVIAWHPTGKILSFLTEEQGELLLFTYYIDKKELKRRNLQYLQKVLSADYSKTGYKLLFSGVRGGQSDIYVFNIASGTFEAITNDLADDLQARFAGKSDKIVFTSNRSKDTIACTDKDISETYDIFLYDYEKKNKTLQRITNTPYINEKNPIELKENSYISSSDESGIINKQIIKHDSTISRVDTSIHYRYYSTKHSITNFPRNILNFDIDKKDKIVYDIILYDNRYRLYKKPLNTDKLSASDAGFKTEYREILSLLKEEKDKIAEKERILEQKRLAKIDSIKNNPPENMVHPDDKLIDINKYIFEKEKKNTYYIINPIIDTTANSEKDSVGTVKIYNYLTNFYTNHLVQQIDFGLLNNSYQFYTGGAYYFNPGINIFSKIGIYDLFENYRISGAFRLGANFNSYEFLFGLENLKFRLDKEYIYHRQTMTEKYSDLYTNFIRKIYTNEFLYILKYPFNQISSTKATISIRHDKAVALATDFNTLNAKNQHQFFAGLKLEYIFDNTFKLGVNLYDGVRFKIFGEFYQELDQRYTNLFVTGLDFRFYKKIHRSLIFASRIAGSASFGKSRLIYYLGGVDNWTVFSPSKQIFDYSVEINHNRNYVYQAVATNMRGFIQNARNGTNFAVMNNELRFPIIRYFANRPLNSAFLNNLQIVGFADVGSAWSGLTPYDEENAYKKEIVRNEPITVEIDKNRWPFVFGYGFGIRSKLFGYFMRFDWAWGIDSDVVLPRVFYFSLNLDF